VVSVDVIGAADATTIEEAMREAGARETAHR
jgi:hypothetical protein